MGIMTVSTGGMSAQHVFERAGDGRTRLPVVALWRLGSGAPVNSAWRDWRRALAARLGLATSPDPRTSWRPPVDARGEVVHGGKREPRYDAARRTACVLDTDYPVPVMDATGGPVSVTARQFVLPDRPTPVIDRTAERRAEATRIGAQHRANQEAWLAALREDDGVRAFLEPPRG